MHRCDYSEGNFVMYLQPQMYKTWWPCDPFQHLHHFAPGPRLNNPLLNVILVSDNSSAAANFQKLPDNVEVVISLPNTPRCHADLMAESDEVNRQFKMMCVLMCMCYDWINRWMGCEIMNIENPLQNNVLFVFCLFVSFCKPLWKFSATGPALV